MIRSLLTALTLAALPALHGAQDVGSRLPDRFELERLTQTEATSLLDFQGRALLIEFFAYW